MKAARTGAHHPAALEGPTNDPKTGFAQNERGHFQQPQLTEPETKACAKNRHRRTQSATVQELNHFRGKCETQNSDQNTSGASQSNNRGNFSEDMERLKLVLNSHETQNALEEINKRTGITVILDDLPSFACENEQINTLWNQKRQGIFKSRDDSGIGDQEKSSSPCSLNIYLEMPKTMGQGGCDPNGRSPTCLAKTRMISATNELKERILQNPLCHLNMREIQEESLEDVMLTGCSESINQKEMNDVLRCISSHKKSSFHNSASHLSSLRSSDAGNFPQSAMSSITNLANNPSQMSAADHVACQNNLRQNASCLFANSDSKGTNKSLQLNHESKSVQEDPNSGVNAKQEYKQAKRLVEMYYADEENKKMVKETLSYFEAKSNQVASRQPTNCGRVSDQFLLRNQGDSSKFQEEPRRKTEGASAGQGKQGPSFSPLDVFLNQKSNDTGCASTSLGNQRVPNILCKKQNSSVSSEASNWTQSFAQEVLKKFHTLESESTEIKLRLLEVEKENASLRKALSGVKAEASKASKV
jgi:hypothetical protein